MGAPGTTVGGRAEREGLRAVVMAEHHHESFYVELNKKIEIYFAKILVSVPRLWHRNGGDVLISVGTIDVM